MSKVSNLSSSDDIVFLQAADRAVFGRPRWVAYDPPQSPLVGWGGEHLSPYPSSLDLLAFRSRRLQCLRFWCLIEKNILFSRYYSVISALEIIF